MNSNQRWNPAFPREKRNRFSPPSCINVEEKKGNGIYIISSRATFSRSRNENLFVACCRAYRSRRAARFQNFPRRPSIDAPRLDSFFRHGSNLHCWRSDASCARALRPSNALRFAWPRARTRGQRVHTYAKSGQDRCEPATWATC